MSGNPTRHWVDDRNASADLQVLGNLRMKS